MPEPAQLPDRYEIREKLGQGGMGIVYRAWDTSMKREVALKTVVEAANSKVLDLFYREWGILASVVHSNIVSIYDIGEFQQEGVRRPFFVMPLLRGATLDKLIRERSARLTIPRLIDIAVQASRGLQHAHDLGLVHRDIKPSNIFVMDDDSVKLIDFGIARLASGSAKTTLKGTLAYLSPEQFEMHPPTPLSDQYSLAVVCFEALAQRLPFGGRKDEEVVEEILYHVPPPVTELNSAVAYPISQVIHKALAKNPQNRFPTTREFGDALQKAQRGEPLKYFDPEKIKPRIELAVENFERGEYTFASDIVKELEGEGHLDQEIQLVKRQLERASAQKRQAGLVEGARRFHEAREYPLALRKIREALAIDPNDPDALALQSLIERERREQKIVEWLAAARRHYENRAYQQARETLDDILKVKPHDTDALRLMADVRRQEEDQARNRERKANLYRQAMESWQRGEVTGAMGKLEALAALEREYPDPSSGISGNYEALYNQVRAEQETLNSQYSEARRRLLEHDFSGAQAICRQALAKYPNHALFQALQYDVQERQSQRLSAVIVETDRRVDEEPDLDRRVEILEEAARQYPGERHFDQALKLVRDKRDLIQSIVVKARYYEDHNQFSEALDQWHVVGSIHEEYPGLAAEQERLANRRADQARDAAKVQWIEQVDRLLESGEHARAQAAVSGAISEFPDAPELRDLETQVAMRIERANLAQELLVRARELVEAARLAEAVPVLREANKLDPRNSVVRALLVNCLLEHARRVADVDFEEAEPYLKDALRLEPSHSAALGLSTQIALKRRDEFVAWCLDQANRLDDNGDPNGARVLVAQGLEFYPDEVRLGQMRGRLARPRSESSVALLDSSPSLVVEQPPIFQAPSAVPRPPLETPPPPPPPPMRREPAPRPRSRRALFGGVVAFAVVAAVLVFLRFRSTPLPPPQVLPQRIIVQVLPEGAAIRIDGQECGVSFCDKALPAGLHRITATLAGYESSTLEVDIPAPGAPPPAPVSLTLRPIAPVLTVSANFDSARFSLDGAPPAPMDRSGFRLQGLAEGPHTIRVSDSRAEATISFDISTRAAPLVQSPIRARAVSAAAVSLRGGSARVHVSGVHVTATFDGKPLGEVPTEGLDLPDLAGIVRDLVLDDGPAQHRMSLTPTPGPALIVSAVKGIAIPPPPPSVRKAPESAPVAVPPKPVWTMAEWEKSGGWQREGPSLTRKGGEYVLMPPSAASGTIRFRAPLSGRRIEWVMNYRDDRNLVSFRLDRNGLERTVVVGGKRGQTAKSRQSFPADQPVDVLIAISGRAINTSVAVGAEWRLLDSVPGGSGQFGFRVGRGDRFELAGFRFVR